MLDVQLRRTGGIRAMKVCIVGASGKLGQYMAQHALDRGYEVVGVCREQSVAKLDAFKGRMHRYTRGDGRPRGHQDSGRGVRRGPHRDWSPGVSTGTRLGPLRRCSTTRHRARAWCSPAGGTSRATVKTSTRGASKWKVSCPRGLGKLARAVDLDDQVEACRRVFASDTRWTVVRGSDLEEGESQGLPVWSRHVGDPILGEQPDAPRGLRPVHGRGPRERRADTRGTRDRRLPDTLGACSRR